MCPFDASQLVKTFFRTNKATCQEWIRRMRHAIAIVALNAGQYALVVEQGYQLLHEMNEAGNSKVKTSARSLCGMVFHFARRINSVPFLFPERGIRESPDLHESSPYQLESPRARSRALHMVQGKDRAQIHMAEGRRRRSRRKVRLFPICAVKMTQCSRESSRLDY